MKDPLTIVMLVGGIAFPLAVIATLIYFYIIL